jgi:hypothetical protein
MKREGITREWIMEGAVTILDAAIFVNDQEVWDEIQKRLADLNVRIGDSHIHFPIPDEVDGNEPDLSGIRGVNQVDGND